MGRDNLCITVPSLFKCPISLEVMKSPVSLSTGITYDRPSIQTWLDGGNNTCPATMQVLQSKDMVPNRTLQRLIEIWSASQQQCELPDAISRADVVAILRLGDPSTSSLSAISMFASASDQNREFLAGLNGLLPFLVDILDGGDGDVSSAEVVIRILDSLPSRAQRREELMNLVTEKCLISALDVLRNGKDPKGRAGSARLIESISGNCVGKPTSADLQVLRALIWAIVKEPNLEVVEAILSCLISLSNSFSLVKTELISLKLVSLLRDLLAGTGDRSVEVVEKTLELMGILSSFKEGSGEICGAEGCLEIVLDNVMKVSPAAAEHAVTVLWAACCLTRNDKARKMMLMSNGMTKMLLLLQSNCSPNAKHMIIQLLRLLRTTSSSSHPLLSHDTNTIHVMPF